MPASVPFLGLGVILWDVSPEGSGAQRHSSDHLHMRYTQDASQAQHDASYQ